jgi:hypothetical protein
MSEYERNGGNDSNGALDSDSIWLESALLYNSGVKLQTEQNYLEAKEKYEVLVILSLKIFSFTICYYFLLCSYC